MMGRKGVSKRKPKKSKALSNVNTGNASNTRAGGNSVVTSLVNGNRTSLNPGGVNQSPGSNKKGRKG